MTTTDRPASSHLVDPELRDAVASFPPFDLSHETLPGIRQGIRAALAAGPDPALAYPGVTCTEHLAPGPDGAPEVRLLVFAPAQRPTVSAALLWMHGGGFVFGSADDNAATCRRIVAETGTVCVAVDYRLAPETPAPGPVDDGDAALRWLVAHADDLGVDRGRLGVGGLSAGAGLAASLAIRARDRGDSPVAFQLLVYPMLDDRTASTRDPHPYAGHYVWTPANNRFGWTALLGHEPGGPDVSPDAAAARVASTAGLPPTFLAVGALDLFAEEDIEFATRLLREGVPVELHVYPGAYHGFEMAADAGTTAAHWAAMLDSLRRHLVGTPTR